MIPRNFSLSKYSFTLNPTEPISLPPYKGFALRGGFGATFKRICCIAKERECETCLLKEKCAYSYIFETAPPKETEKLHKYTEIPRPFVIEPPLDKKTIYQPGELLEFALILIGKGQDYLPYFIFTFQELGKVGLGKGRGKYELVQVDAVAATGQTNPVAATFRSPKAEGQNPEAKSRITSPKSRTTSHECLIPGPECRITIFSSQDQLLKPADLAITCSDILTQSQVLPKKELKLNFQTPTRLRFRGDLITEPEFHHILRALLHRISALSYFHCGEELQIDYKDLIAKAQEIKTAQKNLQWLDLRRYSQRQKTKMALGGFLGEIIYQGNLKPFLPLLLLGSYVHIGKSTVFGFGKYEIS